ncbi:caldesmon-like [Watersipora subatra]|uniref:caldesmon-like n=1 Tax=Watersipora subatra TaxID=2589382 RepID=UPI00355C043B
MKSAGDSPGGGGAESGGAGRNRGGGVKVTRDSEGNTVFSKQKGSESGKNESEGCTLGGSSYRDIAAGIKRRVEESNNRGPDSKLKKPSSSLPFVAKMDSFVEEMESESISTEAAIEQRKAMLLHRRRQVEEQYKRALSATEKDERELEEEIESEKEYREALLHLAAVKQKRAQRRGARSASSVTTTSKESKVEESKEEIQPETSVVRVVPSRDASCEESKVEEPKEEVQPESSEKSGNDDQLAGSEPKVHSGNDDQLAGSEPKVQSGNDDQLAGSEPKVSDNLEAMEEEHEKADWYGDTASMEEGDLLNGDEKRTCSESSQEGEKRLRKDRLRKAAAKALETEQQINERLAKAREKRASQAEEQRAIIQAYD